MFVCATNCVLLPVAAAAFVGTAKKKEEKTFFHLPAHQRFDFGRHLQLAVGSRQYPLASWQSPVASPTPTPPHPLCLFPRDLLRLESLEAFGFLLKQPASTLRDF